MITASNELPAITDGSKIVFPHVYAASGESKPSNYDPSISVPDHHQYMSQSSLVIQPNSFLSRHISKWA